MRRGLAASHGLAARGEVVEYTDDSRVGRVNAYRCDECKGLTVTIDVDAGVTPMFLACRASGQPGDCEGRAMSMGYPPGDPPNFVMEKLAWEWFRPTRLELLKHNAEVRDHVARGGLLLRRRKVDG